MTVNGEMKPAAAWLPCLGKYAATRALGESNDKIFAAVLGRRVVSVAGYLDPTTRLAAATMHRFISNLTYCPNVPSKLQK